MSRVTRCRTEANFTSVVRPTGRFDANPIFLVRPSGRFDAFVDMGNPMKGINLFPYLRQRVEGRVCFLMFCRRTLNVCYL